MADDFMSLARAERAEFAAMLREFTPQQWEAPTLCTEWPVRDVVAHVISYEELTTTALNINALTLQTVETFTTLAVSYLVIVWTMSASIRVVERRLALPEDTR